MRISKGPAVLTFFTILFFIARAMALAPGEAEIVGLKLQGEGCPEGSVSLTLAPDASAFTVLYDRFTITANGSRPQEEINCRVVAEIRKPRDKGVSVEGVDLRGFIALDAGVRGAQIVKVVAGQHGGRNGREVDMGHERWVGPIAENFIVRANPTARTGEVNCVESDKTKLIVVSRVRIKNAGPGKTGTITVDSADGLLMQKYMLNWEDCRPRGGGGGHGGGRGRGPGRR